MNEALTDLSWIDYTALAIILVFVVLGLFRGFLWQMSRLVSLLVSFWIAGIYAAELAEFLETDLGWFEGNVALYAAYFAIFIAVLIVLSLITILLDKVLKRLELKFYDYVGGGVLGLVTGAAIVVALLAATLAFSPKDSGIFQTANASETAQVSRKVLDQINPWLPDAVRKLFPSSLRDEDSLEEPPFEDPRKEGSLEAPADQGERNKDPGK